MIKPNSLFSLTSGFCFVVFLCLIVGSGVLLPNLAGARGIAIVGMGYKEPPKGVTVLETAVIGNYDVQTLLASNATARR